MSIFADEVARPGAYLPGEETTTVVPSSGDLEARVGQVISFLENSGLVFEPWQVAAYIAAVRTKPFVILAGISGTGKTKLPRRIAEATASEYHLRPVKPDWTDSSELLGYETLEGEFRVGDLLEAAREAEADAARQHFFMLDEMNLARVEHYLAEVLSLIEERYRTVDGEVRSQPLNPAAPARDGFDWGKVELPGNLTIVGSVNMDEASHGFSRKVLDRAFTLEFSDVDLSVILPSTPIAGDAWHAEDWRQPMLSLADADTSDPAIARTIAALQQINSALQTVQLQVGYRVRDEIAMFCINARQTDEHFVTRDAQPVDPLDIAVCMKVLPRIQGGSGALHGVIGELISWARGDGSETFPLCMARLELMQRRLDDEGFTSFWL